MNKLELNLLGKDFLDAREAAHYSCVSLRQFQAKCREYGIFPKKFMGKLVYRKMDLKKAIESEQMKLRLPQVKR